MTETVKQRLNAIFNAGLAAVDPYKLILERLKITDDILTVTLTDSEATFDLSQYKEVVVLGCGKAAAPMAKALEALLGDRINRGLICVKYGHTMNLDKIELIEAGHPVPDMNGITAAVKIIDIAKTVGPQSLVFVLSTGGGSALLPAPVSGLSLQDEIDTTQALLNSGADINSVNCVRKHISQLKGGRLAKLLEGATVINLLLSDVEGDNVGTIASGLCAPDFTTFKDALHIVNDFGIEDKIPAKVLDYLQKGADGLVPETPESSDPCFDKVLHVILASNSNCLAACYAKALDMGYDARLINTFFTGEAREVGRIIFGLTMDINKTRQKQSAPVCLICGGEATVTLPEHHGTGGRAMEVGLAFLVEMLKKQAGDIAFLAAATDGNDGPTNAAGAIVTQDLLATITIKDINPEIFLDRHDSYTFFEQTGGLLITGPTNTNVCDVGVIIIS